MHTFEKIGHRVPGMAFRRESRPARVVAIAACIYVGALLSGCASPGPPLPPSLKLPKIVSNLTAERIGDQVVLRWTTPDQTTDGLDIQGPVTAEICRDVSAPAPPPSQAQPKPCNAVLRRAVQPGASEASDDLSTALPAPLNTGTARLLAYRVQLRNAAGRNAGPSAIAYAASGASVPPIQDLHIQPTKAGALLEWKRDPTVSLGDSTTGPTFVDLERTTLSFPSTDEAPGSQAKQNASTKPNQIAPLHLRANSPEVIATGNAADPDGTVDESAKVGQVYTYTAQRVRTAVIGSHTLELRSAVSPSFRVVMTDSFPPDTPTDLVAVPGFLAPETNRNPGSAAMSVPAKPTIDLSWQPVSSERVAGYRVYRSEARNGRPSDAVSPSRINSSLVPTAAYRDLNVESGHTYVYRVTALDTSGNESPPSDPATETAPTP
jgi:hypothetical protein